MYQKNEKKAFVDQVIEFVLLLCLVFFIRTVFFGLYQVPTPSMETTMLVGERFFADKLTYWFRAPRRGEIIAFNDPEFVYSKNKFIYFFQKYVWGPSNWTKRVIAAPGDIVEGKIENGKPSVYVNGQKLDEPYVNRFPLIHVWMEDPEVLKKQIEQELNVVLKGARMYNININQLAQQKWQERATYRSYDPSKSFHDQPFYRIHENRVLKNRDNQLEMIYPQTPITERSDAPRSSKRYWNRCDTFYVQLDHDEYWCMGDNRLGSKDSRFLGPIKADQIHGRILFRIWSLDSDISWAIIDLMTHPIDFWTRVRWSRFLQFVY